MSDSDLSAPRRALGWDKIPGILATRKVLVGGFTLGLGAAMLLLHFVLPPKYQATASIVVDNRGVDRLVGAVVPTSIAHSTMIATHSNIVRSEKVTGQVVEALGFARDPVFLAKWQEATDGVGDPAEWIGAGLLRNVTVRPGAPDSNVLEISYSDRDPNRAAEVANAFANAYLDTQLELRLAPTRQVASFFEERVKANRSALEAAQARLSAYQREHGVLTKSDQNLDVESAVLNKLASELATHSTLRIDSHSRNKHVDGNLQNSSDVLQNDVVKALMTEAAKAEAHVKELSSRYGPEHPHYRAAVEHLRQLHNKLQEESRRVAESMKIDSTIDKHAEAAVREATEIQRKRILDMMLYRDELAVLERDLDNAQKAYDQSMLRLSQSTQESQSLISDASLLTLARVPTESSRPKPTITVPLGVAIGLMLSAILALLLEQHAPLIRVPRDVEEVFGLPILAAIPHVETSRVIKATRKMAHKRNWLARMWRRLR